MLSQEPGEPGTPPGSPPQTENKAKNGIPADWEAVQEIHDAPPVEEHVGNVRGPQGYAWDESLMYTPRDLTTPLQSSMEQLKQHITLVEEEKKQVRSVVSAFSS